MAFQLTSAAFKDGERIPKRYTCQGEDRSPPLAWSGAPAGVQSYALFCDDPDAPAGTWHHWAIFNIPTNADHVDEAYPTRARIVQAREAVNDFGHTGYGGPCPPPGHGTHHYHFRLLALDVDSLKLPERVRCIDVARAARPHVLASAELIGTYAR